MNLATVEREAMEGNRPSEAALRRAISAVETGEGLEASTIIAEVGRKHPAYLAEFSEELGEIEDFEDEFHLEQVITGVSRAISAEPSVFQNVGDLLQNAITFGGEQGLQDIFQAIGTAAESGQSVPDLLIQTVALRIAVCRGGSPVQIGSSMFGQLVRAEGVNNAEAFDLIVGLIETGREDIVRRFGNVLVDLILQQIVPDDADATAAIRVLEEYKNDLTVPSVDVQSALNMLKS